MPGELEVLLVPALFARLRTAAPEVTLTTAQLDRARLGADLAAGRFDLALDVPQPTDPEVAHEPVFDDAFCVVAARRRRRLDKKAYLAAGHVAVSSRRTGPTLEDVHFGAEGLQRRVVVRCQRYETACRIVAASELLLTIPRAQAELRSRLLALRVFAPPLRIPRLRLDLYWLRAAGDSAAGRWVRSELRRVLG